MNYGIQKSCFGVPYSEMKRIDDHIKAVIAESRKLDVPIKRMIRESEKLFPGPY